MTTISFRRMTNVSNCKGMWLVYGQNSLECRCPAVRIGNEPRLWSAVAAWGEHLLNQNNALERNSTAKRPRGESLGTMYRHYLSGDERNVSVRQVAC